MSRTPVESLIARCLMEPRHLERLLASPTVPLPRVELERLRLFGGFISKVQHNDLWDDFPGTRQWLHRAGIELTVFADYRSHHLKPGGPKISPAAKVHQFVRFLEDRLRDQPSGPSSGLIDVVRHERILWEISGRASPTATSPDSAVAEEANPEAPTDLAALSWGDFRQLIPRFQGTFRVVRYARNPLRLIASLKTGSGKPSRRRGCRAPVVLGYWKPPARDSCVLGLDGHEAAILTGVDGRRTVRAVIARARTCGLKMAAPRQFRGFFAEAATAGLITLCTGRLTA